jgi:hypothetical protein
MRFRSYSWQHLTDVPAVLHTAVLVFAVSDDVEFPEKDLKSPVMSGRSTE